jgi:outer membrane protein assembly factor BamB
MRILGCIVTAGLVACSEPIAVDWQRALQAPSVSTPLVTESFIAVGHELGVSLVESDGKPRCLFKTHRDVISAPKTDGKRVFFGSTNYLFYAIDSSCSEVWRFSTGDRIKSDPLVSDGAVFVSSYDGHLYKLDAESGRELWRFPPTPPVKLNLPAPPEPAVQGRRRGKRRAQPRPQPQPPPPPPPPIVAGGFSYSSPVLAAGIVYIGNLDHHVYAIDATRGELRGRFKTDGPVTSTPWVENGTLFFGSNDGNVYAVVTDKLDSGRVLTHDDALWTFRTQDWVNSSPHVADGVLYVGSNDRHVYAIDAPSGRLRWKSETEGPAIATPAVYENLVVAAGASGDGGIYAFQRANGSRFWRRATGGKIESDPVVHGEALYVSSADGHLYRFTFRRTTVE